MRKVQHITDAAGQALTEQLHRADDRTLGITVADAAARYPLTISKLRTGPTKASRETLK